MDNWRQIGDPARNVIGQWELDGAPEAKRSDVPFMGSMGGGGPSVGRTDSPPIAQAFGEEPLASNGESFAGQDGDPAQRGDGANRRTIDESRKAIAYKARMRPASRLVVITGMPSVTRRQQGYPVPTLGRPVLTVVGGRDHAAPRSMTL